MLLSVSDLHKSYAGPDGHLPVLRGIKMLLARGETLALTGESGSGKSTLLHIIGGLDQPDSGIVAIDGVDIGAMDDSTVQPDSIPDSGVQYWVPGPPFRPFGPELDQGIGRPAGLVWTVGETS